MADINPDDYTIDNADDEYLTRVVIDTCSRRFYLYSSEGSDRVVDCDNVDEFMNLLEVIRAVVEDDIVFYADPVVATKNAR